VHFSLAIDKGIYHQDGMINAQLGHLSLEAAMHLVSLLDSIGEGTCVLPE